jgi:hypothetical protein
LRSGYVTPFRVNAAFLSAYEVHTLGSSIHEEYWIPADQLPRFSENIVGPTEVIVECYAQ